MKKSIIISFLLLSCVSIAWCDGPPMDSLGNPTTECYIFTLTQRQIDQAGRERILTLNKQQRSILRKSRHFPNTIHVVTRSYNDCTCDMVYCIWFLSDKVAIPKFDVDTTNEPNELYDGYNAKPRQMICIDSRGDIYYKHKLLTMNDVYKIIVEAAKKDNWLDRSIWISLPPLLTEEKEQAIQKKINAIKKKCEILNVKFIPS